MRYKPKQKKLKAMGLHALRQTLANAKLPPMDIRNAIVQWATTDKKKNVS